MEYRGYDLRWDGVQLLTIHTIGKGALPKALGGAYTTTAFAKNAIDAYLAYKGVKDGETTSRS
jgi:hypothetical protein